MISMTSYSTDTTFTMQSLVLPDTVFTRSVFTSRQLHPVNFTVDPYNRVQPDWVPGIMVFCFILLAWAQVFYHNRIRQIFMAPFSKRFLSQLTRDGNILNERVTVALGIIYLLTFSLLLYECNEQMLKISFPPFHGLSLYGMIILGNITFQTLKMLLVQFLGHVFKTRETTYNYLLNLMIFTLLSGPFILAILVFILYLKLSVFLYLCLAFFVLLLLVRFIRGFLIGMALTKFSYLFLFVYLCSLEILPLLVLLKLLLNQAQTAGV